MDPGQLLAVAAIVAAGSLLGGVSGFGYGLVAAPLLLIVGIPLPTIVLLNLGIGIVTRGVLVVRLRRDVTRRAAALIAGSVPGYLVGVVLLDRIDAGVLKVATGIIVIVVALVSLIRRHPRNLPGRMSLLLAGSAGGALGATTSLNGVVPALVMAQARVPNRQFLADLAAYFIGSGVIGLVAVTIGGITAPHAWLLFVISVPVSVAANLVGASLGVRLPERLFRVLTLGVVIGAGTTAIFS